jgi:hypothetical protein
MGDEPKNYSGSLKRTPDIVEGFKLKLKGFTINMPVNDGITPRPLHSGNATFIALAAQIAGTLGVHGSGIIVAPGIAITAKHVLDELAALPGCTGVIGIGPRVDGGITFWHVVKYFPIGKWDMVIMAIKPMTLLEEIPELGLPVIHARVPEAGERLTVLGFREMTMASREKYGGLVLLQSTGRITTVYRAGRDTVLLPNPCLEVDIDVLGGMSGGPAFDESGKLVGIASSSVGTGEGAFPRPAFVSLVWPAVAWPFSPVWPPSLYNETTTLRELATGLPPEVVNERPIHLSPARFAQVVDADLVELEGKPGEVVSFRLGSH